MDGLFREASANAAAVDRVFLLELGIAFLIFLLVLVVIVAFATRYRRGSTADRKSTRLNSSHI